MTKKEKQIALAMLEELLKYAEYDSSKTNELINAYDHIILKLINYLEENI